MASFGGTVKLTGESEYRKALREITLNLKEVSSELKLTNVQFSNGDKTVKETKTSYDNANSTIKEQREKINALREALSKAEQEYGSNNEKVKTFRTQLNNAETQLASMENQSNKSTKEIKNMKDGFNEAGSGALKFGDILKANVLSEAIVSGIKKLGSVVKEVGTAFIDVGKSAIESYANYEQLIGGVETLFKNSSNIVEDYANNAYKTAGLSANEYMSTVTSFSASLLQSLNGDTAKTAEVSNMAIIDMADNANKMGTSMESIQNAYQGFAKQNYTMLDNLKLGYGGTKTEMERLLADAQKITGVKYDISNLNDVYQAIHVIQGELGITGTTAKEASTTIQGSVDSMKSAWQNMLTGIADDNANFDLLVTNLVESIGIAAENLLPRVEIILDGIIELVVQLVGRISEQLPNILEAGSDILLRLLDGISTMIPEISHTVFYVINEFLTSIISNLPLILQMGIDIFTELINGISQTLPDLIPVAIEAIITMVDTLIDNIDFIIDSGIQLILALADGLIEALPKLIEKIPVIIDKLINAIVNNLPKIIEAGITLVIKLAEGLIKAIPQLIKSIPQIITSIVKGLISGVSQLREVGKNLLQGLWEGMKNLGSWLWEKVKGLFNGLVDKIKNFFGINSPSKLFKEQIGNNLALGIGEGFEDTMGDVTKDMQNAIPTEFDTNATINGITANSLTSSSNTYGNMVNAFKQALTDVKVVMNDREMGTFVTDTMTRVVYS